VSEYKVTESCGKLRVVAAFSNLFSTFYIFGKLIRNKDEK